MTKSIKAALLSALVFPGLGHILLKKYLSAVVLAGAAFGSSYFLVTKTIEKALQITQKIQTGEIPLDVAGMTALISKQSTGTEALLENIATAIFILCWLTGIIDSFRVGRAQDKEAEDNRARDLLSEAIKNSKS